MRITAVRIRELVSGPGFTNHAAEMEAAVAEGEDPHAVLAALRVRVDKAVRDSKEGEEMLGRLDGLREEVRYQEGRLERLKAEIAKAHEVIRSNDRLQRLAAEAGIPWTDGGPTLPGLEHGTDG